MSRQHSEAVRLRNYYMGVLRFLPTEALRSKGGQRPTPLSCIGSHRMVREAIFRYCVDTGRRIPAKGHRREEGGSGTGTLRNPVTCPTEDTGRPDVALRRTLESSE